MNCENCRDNLILLIDGMLGEEESSEINRHLESCRDCREIYHGLLKTSEILSMVNRKNCPEPQNLSSFLEDSNNAAIKSHLECCPFCREELALMAAENQTNPIPQIIKYQSQKLPEYLAKKFPIQEIEKINWLNTVLGWFSTKPALALAGFIMIFCLTLLTVQHNLSLDKGLLSPTPEQTLTRLSQISSNSADQLKASKSAVEANVPVKTKTRLAYQEEAKPVLSNSSKKSIKPVSPIMIKKGYEKLTKTQTIAAQNELTPTAKPVEGLKEIEIIKTHESDTEKKDKTEVANAAYPQPQAADNYAGQAQQVPDTVGEVQVNRSAKAELKSQIEPIPGEQTIQIEKMKTALKKLLNLNQIELKIQNQILTISLKQELTIAEKNKALQLLDKEFQIKPEHIIFKIE